MFYFTLHWQGDTGLGNKVLYDFLREKHVRLILGPSRSNVAESAGATAKYYNMVQVFDIAHYKYSGTSRKRPPNMSSPGVRLREVVAYESLDHVGSKFYLISIWKLQRPTPC